MNRNHFPNQSDTYFALHTDHFLKDNLEIISQTSQIHVLAVENLYNKNECPTDHYGYSIFSLLFMTYALLVETNPLPSLLVSPCG